MDHPHIPNLSRLKIGRSGKLKKTLVLSAHQYPPIQFSQYKDNRLSTQPHYNLQSKGKRKIEQVKLTASCWTQQKLESAIRLFEMYEIGTPGLSFSAIAQDLQLTKEEIAQAWLDFQKNRNLANIGRHITVENKYNNGYLRAKLVNLLQDNPFLSLTELKSILTQQVKLDCITASDFNITQNKIAHLLKSAGYTQRKYSSIGTANDYVQHINPRRQYEFCKLIKQLLPTKTPTYFYHETSFKKHRKSQRALVLRCLLCPSGLAVWLLSQGPFKRLFFQTLYEEMKKKEICLDSIKRKHLILDKQVLTNKQEFCQAIQSHSFDTLSLPPGSLQLNPIQKWFISLQNQLQTSMKSCQYFQTYQTKIQQMLQKYEPHCLYRYLIQFQTEVDQILKNNQQ